MARPTLFDILDLANYPGLVEAVATYLDPGSIIALSRSCKALSAIYPHLLCTQWNVDRRLRRFVRDPRGLRAELSQRNALISGGFACQYFDRAVWQESDLDIWANKGDDASGVLVHILREGYILQTQKERDYADDEEPLVGQLAEVLTLHKCTADGTLQVQIMVTENMPLLAILRHFYTNVVLNIISGTKAYALFAAETFVRRRASLFKGSEGGSVTAGMRKYLGRGFVRWTYNKSGSEGPSGIYRRVGDQQTWIIQFDRPGEEVAAKTPDFVLEYSCFRVDRPDNNAGCGQEYSLSSAPFRACALQYEYVCAHDDSFWMHYLGTYLEQFTLREFKKQKPEDLPERWTGMYGTWHHHDSFTPWVNFRFRDNDIPTWFARWEEARSEEKNPNVFKDHFTGALLGIE